MPELPEVETVGRGLSAKLQGQTLTKLELRRDGLRFPFPAKLSSTVKGQRLTRIERRAKYLLIHLSGGGALLLHLGMSGRLLICDHDDGTRHLHDHVIFHMDGGTIVRFNDARRFGLLDYVKNAAHAQQHQLLAHLGPEPLDEGQFTASYLHDALATKRIAIKLAIMDQAVVVGVGNIYASEALYLAKISPLRAANSLTKADCTRLVKCIRLVLDKAIAAGGSSLRDYVQASGELGYFQHQFAVYDRAGQACPDCSCSLKKTGGIQRISQGGRSTFWCPQQQK